jgi:hypothetical protein
MPEWFFVVGLLAALSALGVFWQPMFLIAPLLLFAVAAPIAQAVVSGFKASFITKPANHNQEIKLFLITSFLHLIQPLARLIGRLKHGLTPWRHRGTEFFRLPISKTVSYWSENWRDVSDRLHNLENALQADGAIVQRNGDFDNGWDLQIRGGMFGGTRLLLLNEEHGQGKQIVRVRTAARGTFFVHALIAVLALLGLFAAFEKELFAASVIGFFAILMTGRAFVEAGYTTAAVLRAIERVRKEEKGIVLSPKNQVITNENNNSQIETTEISEKIELV